uniref:WASH complex subunit 3 n=1 Tax=Panagrolaimus sp. ES5 TaxID=591445 RepID=A0AC34FQQ9_9BILA
MSREPDLSFIQPDVNLKDVSRLETKKVIHLTNEFLLRIADISNSFMQNMETKIFELEKKLDALDTVLILVETKLENVSSKNTVDILPVPVSNVEEPKVIATESSEIIAAIPDNIPAPLAPILPAPVASTVQEPNIEVKQENIPPVVAELIDEGKIKICEHPTFSKYFKMLRLGIPQLGVKQKMASEGVDANLLDTPNALIDAPSANPQESEDESDSDSSFSSSD